MIQDLMQLAQLVLMQHHVLAPAAVAGSGAAAAAAAGAVAAAFLMKASRTPRTIAEGCMTMIEL